MVQFRIANMERFIASLRERGDILAMDTPESRAFLQKALALDTTGDSIYEFCIALADLLDSVLEWDGEM